MDVHAGHRFLDDARTFAEVIPQTELHHAYEMDTGLLSLVDTTLLYLQSYRLGVGVKHIQCFLSDIAIEAPNIELIAIS